MKPNITIINGLLIFLKKLRAAIPIEDEKRYKVMTPFFEGLPKDLVMLMKRFLSAIKSVDTKAS